MSMKKSEQRAVIKHCVGAGMTLVDTLKFMNAGKSCKRGLVYKWHACFSNGRENIADDDQDRRPKTTERVRSWIKEALNEDRRKTIDELADHFDVRHGAVYYIITNELKMTKVSARWVPRLLSEEDKSVRVQRRNIFSNATNGKVSVSCRASLSVMNHGSISMIRRQKLSQWCGNIHHHLHQRRLRSSSLLKKWCSWFLHHSVACRPKRSDDQCNVLPEGILLVVCFSFLFFFALNNS